MTLDSASIFEDCDVSLELSMENSNADRVIRGCKSVPGTAPILSAVNGKAMVWLTRKAYDDNGYWFQVKITALRTEMQGNQDTASTGDIGKIIGITVGIIVFLVILIIICICCYKRRNANEKPQENKNGKLNDKLDNSLSPYVGHGYENNMAKLSYEDSFHQSPGSDRKLLSSDQKSKSALERFGDTSARKEKSEGVDATPKRDRHQNHGFNRNETNFGQDVGRNVSKQRFADECLERASDQSSLTDLSSLAVASKPVSTQKSMQDSKSSPKPSGLRRPRENKSDSNQYQPSATSEFDRYKDGKDEDRSYKSNKNLSSDKYDAGWEKSQRKPDEKRRHNDYEEYDNEERIRDRGPKADRKLRNYSQDDDDSDQMEDTRKNKKRSESSDKHDVSWEKSQRRPDEKRRHNEYDNEDKKREKEIQKKKSERDGRSHSREDVREHEGRFIKSASGRKPKSKNPKMGRSRSTGNALDDLYSDDGKMQPKSSSVRSLSVMDDDDTELDSNYQPFKRSGSKTSLYASRSSLYGRRRKNSMGETMSMSSYALSSYVHDDLDSRVGDFDSSLLSHKEKERLFKSTGDLNVSSAIIVRECATQTGSSKEVSVYGKRTVPQRKHGKRYNRGTQTTRQRRDSGASEKSGRSERSGKSVRSNRNLRSKSRSKESLSRRHRSRSRDLSDDDTNQYHSRSKSNQREKYTSDRNGKSSRNKSKERSHSRQRHRDHSESEDEQSQYSSKSYETNKTEQNSQLSFAPYSSVPAQHAHQYGQQIPQFLPAGYPPAGYPMVIQQPTTAFISTDQNGMPVIIPVTSLTERAIQQKPAVPVKPNASKWDQLVNITDDIKKRRHQMGESLETESVMSSVWSQPRVHRSESPYTKTQKMQGSDRIYGSQYAAAYDVGTPDSEYTVGYSRNYSATDSSV
ncbi:unnamed protein product [Candidula unifasciata]|uniref:Uncharacterized protein n=1 Tax=Candidula unifasciata TaxID=100452 RepID=A0A8S3ZA11_9EUPU|nr:unnamed protein product [Candidula unifasciata]